MPFDVRDFPGVPPEDKAANRRNRQVVAAWLFTICGMILVMIVLGLMLTTGRLRSLFLK